MVIETINGRTFEEGARSYTSRSGNDYDRSYYKLDGKVVSASVYFSQRAKAVREESVTAYIARIGAQDALALPE